MKKCARTIADHHDIWHWWFVTTHFISNLLSLQWRQNEHDSVSNHQPDDCLFKVQIKENIKASRHWPLCGEFTSDRSITRTKGQLRGKCFHLMTSSCHRVMYICIFISHYVTPSSGMRDFIIPGLLFPTTSYPDRHLDSILPRDLLHNHASLFNYGSLGCFKWRYCIPW